ncbi:MAG: hypothetical protein Q8M88_05710, partial [Phenylobacterium sp.]|uniref:hypothetical protein n=1 Tax=Phenylobacterium sp. TaxID=1871053 RepID=UPI00273558C5
MSKVIYKRNQNFQPDFQNIIEVLQRKKPNRPTLFEFAINDKLAQKLSGMESVDILNRLGQFKNIISAFANAGYD